MDNGAGVVIYLRDGHNHSLQCSPARQRLDDIENQILADLGINPDTVALLMDPLGVPTGGKADAHPACSETFGGDALSRVLRRHDRCGCTDAVSRGRNDGLDWVDLGRRLFRPRDVADVEGAGADGALRDGA